MKKINFYCGKVNSQGGSKISLLNIIYLFNEENIKFEVFINNEGWFTKKLSENKIKYTIIKEPKLIEKINKHTNLLYKTLFLIISLPKLFVNWIKINKKISNGDKVILNENRDLILFFPALFRRRVELIQWIRSEYVGKVTKLLINKVDKVIAVSDIVKNNIANESNKPIYRIHNFMFNKPVDVKRKSINNEIIKIAIVGSIQQIKGQLDAVRVLKRLNEDKMVCLHILGREFNEYYTNDVKDYIKKYNLEESVKFLGHVDNVTEYLNNNIHLTLIPSQTESFCRVAMESISVGIPVVAYKVGGLKEVILNGETGILIEKDNIAMMTVAVNKLISDNELYTQMSREALENWSKRFYSESVKHQIFDVLKLKGEKI